LLGFFFSYFALTFYELPGFSALCTTNESEGMDFDRSELVFHKLGKQGLTFLQDKKPQKDRNTKIDVEDGICERTDG